MAAAPTTPIPEPLRLPHGSVRGTIGIIVSATYAYLLLRDGQVPSVVINAVIVVIAFYFGTRAAVGPGSQMPGQPTRSVPQPNTRHIRFVRGLLFLGFAGLAAWFLRTDPLHPNVPPALVAVLEVLAGYVSGATVSWLIHRRAHVNLTRRRLATLARDLIALGALSLTAYTCYALATGQAKILAIGAVDALSLVVTFYFGSRVIGH